jgi:SM-20-related protein
MQIAFRPELNGALDIESAKAQFAFQRRVQVRDFFAIETANRIYECLMTETPWGFAYLDGRSRRMLHRRELESITRSRSERIAKTITSQAAACQDAYGYFCYPVSEAAAKGWNPELALHALHESLTATPMLDLVRAISGRTDINAADAQATLFSHQHFATSQNSSIMGTETTSPRQIAYVLNFTQGWQEDWGGYLQFHTKDGDICQAYKPCFNTLTLFEMPQQHGISYVPPFAAVGRLTVSGSFSVQ